MLGDLDSSYLLHDHPDQCTLAAVGLFHREDIGLQLVQQGDFLLQVDSSELYLFIHGLYLLLQQPAAQLLLLQVVPEPGGLQLLQV